MADLIFNAPLSVGGVTPGAYNPNTAPSPGKTLVSQKLSFTTS